MADTASSNSNQNALKLIELMHQVRQSVLEESETMLAEQGVSLLELTLLDSVQSYPNPSKLADAVAIPASSVSRMLRRLEKDGYVERHSVPNDLRRFEMKLSRKGKKAVDKGLSAVNDLLEPRMKRLKKKELKALEKNLALLLPASA